MTQMMCNFAIALLLSNAIASKMLTQLSRQMAQIIKLPSLTLARALRGGQNKLVFATQSHNIVDCFWDLHDVVAGNMCISSNITVGSSSTCRLGGKKEWHEAHVTYAHKDGTYDLDYANGQKEFGVPNRFVRRHIVGSAKPSISSLSRRGKMTVCWSTANTTTRHSCCYLFSS